MFWFLLKLVQYALLSEPLAERLSRATIPVFAPIASVKEALESRTPKEEVGSRKDSLGEHFARSELSWDLKRSPLRVSGKKGTLSVATKLSGEARATGVLQLVRKIDVSASGDVLASVSLTAHPTLKTNWRLSPNLSETKIDIQRADIPIKRSSVPKLSRGFHAACEDLKPARRFVAHGGRESFVIGKGVEALSLRDMMETVSEL